MRAQFADAEAVYFDVDNTLYDFDESVRHTLGQLQDEFPDVLGAHDVHALEARYYAANSSMSEAFRLKLIAEDPHLYRRATWQLFLEREAAGVAPHESLDPGKMPQLLDSQDHDGLPDRLARRFSDWRFRHLERAAYPGARETVEALQAAGKTVGIITNGPSVFQRAKFNALRYHEIIPEKLVLVSEEFGAKKPHPSIFREAASRAGVPAERIVYVGDSVECDVASKGVGMSFIFFDAARGPRPDFQGVCGYEPDAIAHDYADVQRLLGLR